MTIKIYWRQFLKNRDNYPKTHYYSQTRILPQTALLTSPITSTYFEASDAPYLEELPLKIEVGFNDFKISLL